MRGDSGDAAAGVGPLQDDASWCVHLAEADLGPVQRWRRSARRWTGAAIVLLIAAQFGLFGLSDDQDVLGAVAEASIVAGAIAIVYVRARSAFALAMRHVGPRLAGERCEPPALWICDPSGSVVDVGLLFIDRARDAVRIEGIAHRYQIQRRDVIVSNTVDLSVPTPGRRRTSQSLHAVRYRVGEGEATLELLASAFSDRRWRAARVVLGSLHVPSVRRPRGGPDFRQAAVEASERVLAAHPRDGVSTCVRVPGASARAPRHLRAATTLAIVLALGAYAVATALALTSEHELAGVCLSIGLMLSFVFAVRGLLKLWIAIVVRGVANRMQPGYAITIGDPDERVRTVEDVGIAIVSKFRGSLRIEGWTHRYDIYKDDVISAGMISVQRPLFRGSTRALVIRYRVADQVLSLVVGAVGFQPSAVCAILLSALGR